VKVLVTGCAGFIGWKVSERLLADGHPVIGADNLNRSYDIRLKRWRLAQMTGQQGFSFHPMSVVDRDQLSSLFDQEPWDAVINLAALAGVRASIEDPWGYYETNLTGTLNLLELCQAQGVGKFVLASSSSVYGAGDGPFREDMPTDRPLSPYAASKKAAEELCHFYHHACGMDISLLRFFTVYGPAGRPDMAVFRFIKWIHEGKPLIVYGDGSQRRDFTYVDDIASGTVLALKPVGFEAFNLGSDRPVLLNALIDQLQEMLHKKAKVQHQPPHSADVPSTWADITKAGKILGWRPEATLEQGLRRAVDWYLENRAWAREV